MTRLPPQWSQEQPYPAAQDRQLIRAIWSPGVMGMTAAIVPDSMQVQIEAGRAVVPDPDPVEGAWLCTATAAERVQIGTPPAAGQNRIDLIVVTVDDPNRQWEFLVVPGSPSSSAVRPATPPGATAVWAVQARGGSAVLQAGDLVDRRQLIGSIRMGDEQPGPADGVLLWLDTSDD